MVDVVRVLFVLSNLCPTAIYTATIHTHITCGPVLCIRGIYGLHFKNKFVGPTLSAKISNFLLRVAVWWPF